MNHKCLYNINIFILLFIQTSLAHQQNPWCAEYFNSIFFNIVPTYNHIKNHNYNIFVPVLSFWKVNFSRWKDRHILINSLLVWLTNMWAYGLWVPISLLPRNGYHGIGAWSRWEPEALQQPEESGHFQGQEEPLSNHSNKDQRGASGGRGCWEDRLPHHCSTGQIWQAWPGLGPGVGHHRAKPLPRVILKPDPCWRHHILQRPQVWA